MIKSYFNIAWRNLWRNKFFSVIKIMGLSIGLTACILILLYTKDEISYDQFHVNKGQLYRVIQNWKIGKEDNQTIGTTNTIVGESFQNEIPEVQQCVHINGVPVTVKGKNNEVFRETPLFVDENFFTLFTFPLSEGNSKTALKGPYSAVLSKATAIKYFGTTHVIGKTMQLKINEEFENFTVSAVADDFPQNSTLKAGILLPFGNYQKYNDNLDWIGGSVNTFLLISPSANTKTVEGKMQSLFDKNTKEQIAKIKQEKGLAINIKLALQPLTAIHLSEKAGPDNGMTDGSTSTYSYILSTIAVFILVIACINFINLAVAQSLRRSKEIGIRKVMGSTRKQLIRQFLLESFLVSLIAFAIAVFLASVLLPLFNELAGKKLSLSYLSDGYLYAGFFLLLIVTSLIAGFYPSLVLSGYQPVKVLYGRQKIMGKNYFTKGLIVLQFGLAIVLIIGAISVNFQMDFLSKADLGYDTKNLVRIEIPVRKSSDKLPALFKNELSGHPGILAIAAKNGGRNASAVKVDGKNIIIEKNRIDDSFLPTFKIPLIAGRNFSAAYPTDVMKAVIVNESFVREAGWAVPNAIGKTINYLSGENKSATIIGVIKNYHYTSLKEKINPELLTMDSNFNYGQIWVKFDPAKTSEMLSLLAGTFKKLVPYFPYSYDFMDDIIAKNYNAEEKWKQIIGISSALFIFISCIGLLGLVNLSIEQRTREIGIRKVLGAAVSRILLLISRDFIMLISVAFIIAVPLGYYLTNRWLESFAYRINTGWRIFATAGVATALTALVTISIQAIKAARANPVKSLRTE